MDGGIGPGYDRAAPVATSESYGADQQRQGSETEDAPATAADALAFERSIASGTADE